jgi:hypothetical protein
MLCEDDVKRLLKVWLEASGWQVSVIWGRGRGIDVIGAKDGKKWIIEVKGLRLAEPDARQLFPQHFGRTASTNERSGRPVQHRTPGPETIPRLVAKIAGSGEVANRNLGAVCRYIWPG